MTDIHTEIALILAGWIGLNVLVARGTIRSATGSIGLPAAYIFATTFIYCGVLAYAVPGYSHLEAGRSLYLKAYDFTESTVLAGTWATSLGLAGFAIGALLPNMTERGRARPLVPLLLPDGYRRPVILALGAYAFLSFFLNALEIRFPMAQAILQVGRNVGVVVVCLGAAMVILVDRKTSYTKWLGLAVLLPSAYLVVWGFVSYGFIVFTVVASFWLAVLSSRRTGALTIGAGATVLVYFILSAFIGWMMFREEIRAVVWAGGGLEERLSVIVDAVLKIKPLSLDDFEALDWLNTRLNQYIFVGKTIEWHAFHPHLRLNGETLLLVFLVWVPRFLWPEKPAMGGSTFLSEHTGMNFQDGVTFGAGPVIEFYVNFGHAGIFIGFLFLGLLIRWIDRAAAVALREGRLLDCTRLFTVGIAFIAPQTDLFFMVNTAAMSWLILSGLKILMLSNPTAVDMRRQLTAGRG